MGLPIAYHVTFGTYGARLHGSRKPYVDRAHNVYGTPFPEADAHREAEAGARMKAEKVVLTREQRRVVETAVGELCGRYGWGLRAIAAQSDHVHVVVTAPREGQKLRDAIKAVATRALNKKFGERVWWAEKGSVKYLWDEGYLRAATGYVRRQRDF